MPTSKFRQFLPFFAILCPFPPLKTFHFCLPDNYAWEGCQSNHCVQKPPKGHFLVLPRDQSQRNSLKKMKWEVCQKYQFVVKSSFVHKYHSQGVFWTRRVPWGHKKLKKSQIKNFANFCHFSPFCARSPLWKKSISGSPTIMHGKTANRTTVSKNLPRDTF